MRQWHRRISIVVGLFMLFIALTGALLQAESLFNDRDGPGAPPPGKAAPARVTDEEAAALLATSLAGAHKLSGGALMGIELRFNGQPTAEVVVAEPTMRRLRLDARTGAPLDAASQPGRRDLHGILLDLHNGEFAGTAGMVVSLLCGIALAALGITGLTLYVQTWRRRRAAGQAGFLW